MRNTIFTLLLTFFTATAWAQFYTPDPGFNGSGAVVTGFYPGQDAGRALVVQPDGKTIVAGSTYDPGVWAGPTFIPGTQYNFAMCRYHANGSPDNAFGTTGKVITDFDSLDQEAKAMALQPDGKIILAGFSYDEPNASIDFALARYLADGSPDLSFGAGGKVLTFLMGDAQATRVLVQPDGKILAGGLSQTGLSDPDFTLVRYLTNGTLDSSFGMAGVVRTDFTGGSEETVSALVLQPDGKIILAGSSRPNSSIDFDFAIARYLPNGSLDAGFGSGGKRKIGFGDIKEAVYDMVLQPDGKILLVGDVGTDFTGDFGLVRLLDNGLLDNTFGSMGKVINNVGPLARCLTLLPGGEIAVGTGMNNFGIFFYDSTGGPDSSFAAGAYLQHTITGTDMPADICLQPDGKIVMTGTGTNGFVTARYYQGSPLSIDEEQKNPAFNLFPNPAQNTFTIAYTLDQSKKVSCALLDVQGRKIKELLVPAMKEKGLQKEQCSVADLEHGIYMVEMTLGDQKVLKPLIKQ